MSEVELKTSLTGLAIRDFLLEKHEASANDVLRALRKVKKKTSYDSVRRYARENGNGVHRVNVMRTNIYLRTREPELVIGYKDACGEDHLESFSIPDTI